MSDRAKTRDQIRAELAGRDPVYGYVRVSTAMQVDSGLGLQAQRAEVEHYAEQNHLSADGPIVLLEDRGVSGSTPFGERQAGGRLAALLRQPWAAHRAHVILRVDRAWRSMYDAMDCLREWERLGVRLHLVDLPVDPWTLLGRKMVLDRAFLAEFERASVMTRTKAANRAARKNGQRYSGSPPWGFKFEKGTRNLVQIAAELATCGRLLELGMVEPRLTHQEIANVLNREGRPLKLKPNGIWSKDRVRRVLAKVQASEHRDLFKQARAGEATQ